MIRSFIKSALLAIARALRLVRTTLRCPHPQFVDIEALLARGQSVVRWGDGETSLLGLRSIGFQRASVRLAFDLYRVLVRTNKRYVLCVPPHLNAYPEHLANARYRALWTPTILLWELLSWRFGRRVSDAYAFRTEGGNRSEVLRTLLSNCNICCVVSKDAADSQAISALAGKPILHVKCPPGDAYEQYALVRAGLLAGLKELDAKLSSELPTPKPLTVLLSAGPAGKILISELASNVECRNVQLVDVGHFFDHGLPP